MSIFLLPKEIHNKENIQMKEYPEPSVQEVPCKFVESSDCDSENSKYPNKKFCNGCIKPSFGEKNMMECCKSKNINNKDKCYQWTMTEGKATCVPDANKPYTNNGMKGVPQPIHPENPNKYGCYHGICTKVSTKDKGVPLEQCKTNCRPN